METIDEEALGAAEKMRTPHLEAQVVELLAERLQVDMLAALDVWYRSELATSVERNEHGLQYLDAAYLVDELLTRIATSGGSIKQLSEIRD